MKQGIFRKVSIILFSIGALIGFLLAVGTIWAHLEMPFYFEYSYAAVSSANQGYSALECPILLTNADSGLVSVDITNTADKVINIRFQGEISYMGGITRNVEFTPAIPVGETSRIQFEVNKDDVVFNNLILVRTYQFSTYQTPALMGSCAIFMIPISFLTGNELLILTLLFSGLSIIIGIVLWIANNRPMIGLPRSALIAMITVSLLVLAAVIAGIAGWWIPGILLLMVIIIMAVVSIGAFQTSPTSTRW
jgi:hypothetical protein